MPRIRSLKKSMSKWAYFFLLKHKYHMGEPSLNERDKKGEIGMISTQELRNKEVINIYDGKSLGYVYDIEVNLEKGTIEGIIVPVQRSFLSFFGWGGSDYVIKWKDIRRIGDDVILVDVAGLFETDAGYERNHISKPRYVAPDKDRYKDSD